MRLGAESETLAVPPQSSLLRTRKSVDRVEEIERWLAASSVEEHRTQIPDIVVDAGGGPDSHLPIAERIPCQTNSWAEGVQGRVTAPERAGNCALVWAGPIGRGEVSNLPVMAAKFRRYRAKLVPESQVQRQARENAVIILECRTQKCAVPKRGPGRAIACLRVPSCCCKFPGPGSRGW